MAGTLTLDDYRERVYQFAYGSRDDEEILFWLNMSIKELARRWRWSWLEKTASFATVASQAYTAFPADFQYWGRLRRASGDSGTYAVPEFVSELDPRYDHPSKWYNVAQGEPKWYTLWAEQCNWYPTPDAVYTYTLDYWFKPTEFTSTPTSTCTVPDEFSDVLVHMVLLKSATREDDLAKQQTLASIVETHIQQMMRDEKTRQRQNRRSAAMPDHYYGQYDSDIARWRRR